VQVAAREIPMRCKEQRFRCENGEMLDHKPRDAWPLLSLEVLNTQLDKVPSSLNFYVILQITMK